MIRRPPHLDYVETDFEFNGQLFSELEIDLNHINKSDRSAYGLKDIQKALKIMVEGKTFSPSGHKVFRGERCTYYAIQSQYRGHSHKLVLCICSDKSNTLGVITFYREDR